MKKVNHLCNKERMLKAFRISMIVPLVIEIVATVVVFVEWNHQFFFKSHAFDLFLSAVVLFVATSFLVFSFIEGNRKYIFAGLPFIVMFVFFFIVFWHDYSEYPPYYVDAVDYVFIPGMLLPLLVLSWSAFTGFKNRLLMRAALLIEFLFPLVYMILAPLWIMGSIFNYTILFVFQIPIFLGLFAFLPQETDRVRATSVESIRTNDMEDMPGCDQR